MVLTGVRAHFCASHADTGGRLHGHSYVVWAWFPAGRDAVELQNELGVSLDKLDHSILPASLAAAEAIAEFLAKELPAVCRVSVNRPVEGLAAEWAADA